MKLTAIIPAHNEEATVPALLEVVLGETFAPTTLEQVLVVSSASTDRTDALVQETAARDPRVVLLQEPERRGKCAAINWALREMRPVDVVLLLSADVRPEPGALARLVAPFEDPGVGMTGGRPLPTNPKHTLFGHAAHLLWAVHHRIALQHPKLGEVVAFRAGVDALAEDLAVDEAALEARFRREGLRLVYVPEAIIRNRGPDNLKDFLSQRRRISAGHRDLEQRTGYQVSTGGLGVALGALLRELRPHPRHFLYSMITAALCLWGRWLGAFDQRILRRRHAVWDIARSTKQVDPPEATGP